MSGGWVTTSEHFEGQNGERYQASVGLEIGLEFVAGGPIQGKRGPYPKSYVVPHGRGFKYVRAIPKDLQRLEKKCAWVKCLGAVSRSEARSKARVLALEHGKRIAALRALSEDERRAIRVATVDREARTSEFTSHPVDLGIGLTSKSDADEEEPIKPQRTLTEMRTEIVPARTTPNRMLGQGAGVDLMGLVELW